jgi:hypothetical protein
MLDDKAKVLIHHKGKIENKAILIVQQAVNKDPKLCIEAQPQLTAAVYGMG